MHQPLSAAKGTRATSLQGDLLPNRLVHPAGAFQMLEHVDQGERGSGEQTLAEDGPTVSLQRWEKLSLGKFQGGEIYPQTSTCIVFSPFPPSSFLFVCFLFLLQHLESPASNYCLQLNMHFSLEEAHYYFT